MIVRSIVFKVDVSILLATANCFGGWVSLCDSILLFQVVATIPDRFDDSMLLISTNTNGMKELQMMACTWNMQPSPLHCLE